MNKLVTFLLTIGTTGLCQGQAQSTSKKKQEEILPMPYEQVVTKGQAQTNAVYWENQVNTNNKDKNAMLNLVIANRQLGNANFYLYNQEQVRSLTDSLNVLAPNSFEAEYATYLTTYPTAQAFDALDRAKKVAPAQLPLNGPMMEKALVENNKNEAKQHAIALAAENSLDRGLISVADDASMSAEKNAIIFCEGEMDCYPLYSQQASAGLPDSKTLIVNRQLLGNAQYRENTWQQAVGNGTSPNSANATIKEICSKSSKSCFLTLSLDRSLIIELQGKLYLTGNLFKYSATPIKNIPILEKNWGKMDGQEITSPLNSNYLVPAIALKNHYSETGQRVKAEALEKQIVRIANKNGKTQQLKNAGIIK